MRMEVLIADDELDLLDQYRVSLEAKGHNVITCKDGQQCVKVYLTEYEHHAKDIMPFDAVVLDYQMPQKNGYAVGKDILGKNRPQRIIFGWG